ncbi:hypothetical protein Pint_34233 [Pistacia integerrima]|uniref:Uncharacterized protein n=1 Tax=Pistacia integerrima TaxID=434235 RepID=A0ACC0X2M0_9ROSI|nr:hypothetical protein Pint_34233 [Pistacia integerrima]
MESNFMEAISLVSGGVVSQTNEDGVKRMKIVVKKEDLKQMIDAMRGCEKNVYRPSISPSSPLVAEKRLNLLNRRHLLRASKESRRRTWRPALHSIAEEI